MNFFKRLFSKKKRKTRKLSLAFLHSTRNKGKRPTLRVLRKLISESIEECDNQMRYEANREKLMLLQERIDTLIDVQKALTKNNISGITPRKMK